MYPNYASPQRPIVTSNDLVKGDFNCSKEDVRQDSKYLQPRCVPQTCLVPINEDCNVYANKKR